MTYTVVTTCCLEGIRYEAVDPPPPPGALLQTADNPPEVWRGWNWVCEGCGAIVGFTYDYGTLDLGIVRDSVLTDRPEDGLGGW